MTFHLSAETEGAFQHWKEGWGCLKGYGLRDLGSRQLCKGENDGGRNNSEV